MERVRRLWTACVVVLGTILLILLATNVMADGWELEGEVAAEMRVFPQAPRFDAQERATASPSLRFQPELIYEWNNGSDRLVITPFGRVDWHDSQRTHFDLREAHWLHQASAWTLLIGISKVFWGVTESRHLVDIINQTDQVEDIDNEDKLGQPMLNLSLEPVWGTIDLFVLPAFRERIFPAADARLRGAVAVRGDASYESSLEEWHPDWAARYSHVLGDLDIAIAHFRGTSREPRFQPCIRADGRVTARARYDIIDQTSLDMQWTRGAWLWKLEAIGRRGHGDYFGAAVGGFEYTLFQLWETDADLGLLGEYLYDGRSRHAVVAPPTSFERDIFLGARLALNDVPDAQVLAGAIVDNHSGETFGLLEASRRFGQHVLVDLEARWFFNTDSKRVAHALHRDGFITLRWTLFF